MATVEVSIMDLREIRGDLLLLIKADIFNFKNGSKTIHRDSNGRLRRITSNLVDYES